MSQSSQPTFLSVDNRRLIWSSLVEASYFQGFPPSQKDMVKRVLDSVVHEVSQTPAFSGSSLPEKNREVVRQMLSYRDLWSQDGTIGSASTGHNSVGGNAGQGYVSQVTAEEIREQRASEFNDSLRAKQAEMEGYLQGTRPQSIDFSDSTQEQKIGGDMERLVAEAEAERKRQMDALFAGGLSNDGQDAEKWVNGGRPIKVDNSSTLQIDAQEIGPSPTRRNTEHKDRNTRRVRFSDDNGDGGVDGDIFAKLKRKPSSAPIPSSVDTNINANINANELLTEIHNVKERVGRVEENLERLLTIINSLYTVMIDSKDALAKEVASPGDTE